MRALPLVAQPAKGCPPWHERCRFALLPIEALRVDGEGYQRALGHNALRRIARMGARFDWARFGAVVLREAGAHYELIDGQHRAAAAWAAGAAQVPAVIIEPRAADEPPTRAAEVFVALNRDRASLTPVELYHAELAAGDSEARRIAAILGGVGITVPRRQRRRGARPMECLSVGVLRAVLRRQGPLVLEAALGMLAEAWAAEPGAFDRTLIAAAARLAEALLGEAADSSGQDTGQTDLGADLTRAAQAMAAFGKPAALRRAAMAAAHEHGGRAWQHAARLVANRLAEHGGPEIALGVD